MTGFTGSETAFKKTSSYFFKHITVEPIIALLVIPSTFSSLATQNLNLDKACLVNLQFSEEVCMALRKRDTKLYNREDAEVSKLVAKMGTWTSLMSVFPVILVLFAGSWSDKHQKRKPFMVAPLVGEFLGTVSHFVCVIFFYNFPMQISGFAGKFFANVTGGWTILFMAAYSYIADITTVKSQTLRIGLVDVFFSCGVPLGTALSGVLVKYAGYYGVYSLSGTFYILGIVYGVYFIKEASDFNPQKETCPNNTEEIRSLGETNHSFFTKQKLIMNFLKDFFDTCHFKETMQVILRKDSENRRKMILLLIVVPFVFGPLYGEMTVMYLFMRYRFNWDEVQFSMFSTYSVITHLIGTSVSVGVFSHMLKMDDALIGVMSCTSKILAGFVYAFAQTEWQVYLAPLVDIVNGTSLIAMRSIASKLVPPEELGKLNSLYGACEALTPLLYGPLYATVYAHTMDTLPGAFLLLGGALTLPAVIIFGWMYTQHRGDKLRSEVSRQPSVTEEVLKTLRVDPVMMVPATLDPLDIVTRRPSHKNLGQDNLAFHVETH